ncbi:MAG: hypothetical protein ABWZ98_17215, partial [Nakamurella sp.]
SGQGQQSMGQFGGSTTGRPDAGNTDTGRAAGQTGRPFAPIPTSDPLPPPPWASSDSATLAPLPATADGPAGHGRVIAAIVAALIAAVIGFFGVRVIADLATDDSAAATSSVSTAQN